MSINLPTTSSSQLSLRRATRADSSLIARMHAESWAATYRGLLPDAFLDGEAPADRAVHWATRMEQIEAGDGIAWIAESNGQPIGFVCLVEPDKKGSVLVDNLHALPGFKGAGAGTAMLAAAQQWARERGARSMHLSVLDGNAAAVGFYESRGWRYTGREDDRMGGIDIIALVYTLALN